jgi:hypothetical protein
MGSLRITYECALEGDAYGVDPLDFSPWFQHNLTAADYIYSSKLTHRHDSSASVEPMLSIQTPEASLALLT